MPVAFRWIGLVLAALVVAAALAGGVMLLLPRPAAESTGTAAHNSQQAKGELKQYSEVPDFNLTNHAGETITDDQLRSHIWVADFIFTSCPSICPTLTANLRQVQTWLADKPWGESVKLVSFSVDPENDRPAELRSFANQYDADLSQWQFVTGPSRARMWQLSEDGFNLGVRENPAQATMAISHSAKFVLVDREGRIRGYYTGTTTNGVAKLKQALIRLVAQDDS